MSLLAVVDREGLPIYAIPTGVRLEAHWFYAFEFNRHLNSTFSLKTSFECLGMAVNLFCHSQNQDPVGTLPNDEVELSTLLRTDLHHWRELCRREYGPLYNWSLCLTDLGVVRLHHPVVEEVTLRAFQRKLSSQRKRAADRDRKALKALSETQIQAAGGTRHMAENPIYVERLHGWLLENCDGNRTLAWVRRGMEALSSESL